MKKLIIVSTLCLTSLITLPALAAHKNLNLADLKSATYKLPLFADAPADVYHLGRQNGHSMPPEELTLHEYAFGDLNGDGLGDAITLLGYTSGGSGNDMSLVVLINNHGKAKSVDWITLQDRTGCESLKIINQKIIYDALVHKPHGACWGELPKKFVYRLVNNKLIGPRNVAQF